MRSLKELIRLYTLTSDEQVKAWLRDAFENAKMDVFVTCKDSEVKEVQGLSIGG